MSLDYHGYIIDSSFNGNITARAKHFWTFVGGVAGCIAGRGSKIERCYATGTLSLDGTSSPWPYIGGVTGYNYYEALVSQCYFEGTVEGNSQAVTGDQQVDGVGGIAPEEYTGGVAGYNSKGGRIEDCYSRGEVKGYAMAGGVVGQNIASTVSRCYSAAAVSLFSGNGQSGGVIAGSMPGDCYALYGVDPKPGQSAFAGWDFADVWEMGGDGYPHLRWETP
jgi:hypothetical protein